MPYGMNMLLWTADATGENFLALFERLKKMGFDSVEIPIMTPDVKKYAELGRRLENMGLKRTAVTVLTSETNLIGTDKKQREGGVAHLKAVAESCQALGSSLLVGPIYAALGVFTGKGPTNEEWQWAAEGLREAAEGARKCGVTLVAEYLNRFEIYLLNCCADAARMVKDVNHPNFRMMYDTFHANIEEKDITAALAGCADVMIHVHISENDRSTPGKGGCELEGNLRRAQEDPVPGLAYHRGLRAGSPRTCRRHQDLAPDVRGRRTVGQGGSGLHESRLGIQVGPTVPQASYCRKPREGARRGSTEESSGTPGSSRFPAIAPRRCGWPGNPARLRRYRWDASA